MMYTNCLPLPSSEFSAPKLCWRLRSVGLAQSVAYGLSPCSLKPKNLDRVHLNACCLTWWCVTGWTVPILANGKIRASPSLTHPTEHFQI
ncbi:MAG: hypothetical protein F6K26_23705 [Moorea sp. SIO2I5]|nr:hypothetical protein [Moorena sp. SIO2I5]